MTDGTAISTSRQPMWISDVLLILAMMALFLFALQPREHAHGARRREADNVSDVQAAPVTNRWQHYDTLTRHAAMTCSEIENRVLGRTTFDGLWPCFSDVAAAPQDPLPGT